MDPQLKLVIDDMAEEADTAPMPVVPPPAPPPAEKPILDIGVWRDDAAKVLKSRKNSWGKMSGAQLGALAMNAWPREAARVINLVEIVAESIRQRELMRSAHDALASAAAGMLNDMDSDLLETGEAETELRTMLRMSGFLPPDPDAQQCRRCGCTDNHACDGGCEWISEDLCSACAMLTCQCGAEDVSAVDGLDGAGETISVCSACGRDAVLVMAWQPKTDAPAPEQIPIADPTEALDDEAGDIPVDDDPPPAPVAA